MTISVTTRGVTNGACTSTTRPENPTVGQVIFETDTGLQKVWLGSAWSVGYNYALQAPSSIEVLVIAGGGGGARSDANGSGGGGGGGYLEGTFSITANQAYTVTVGAGGSARTSQSDGASGANSVFATATAVGGGGGGVNAGVAGGSGGGGGNNASAGAGTQSTSGGLTGFGNAGAASGDGGFGGGGGGAGGAGGLVGALSPVRRNGGVGKGSTISGLFTIYAAGGTYINGAGIDGFANLGNGGTGTYQFNSGAGGSGVVILAYPNNFKLATSTTGSPTYSAISRAGYHVYTFTGSGSVTF